MAFTICSLPLPARNLAAPSLESLGVQIRNLGIRRGGSLCALRPLRAWVRIRPLSYNESCMFHRDALRAAARRLAVHGRSRTPQRK